MSIAIKADLHDAHSAEHGDQHHEEHHDTSGNTLFGFWIYLMTDCILFASVFATYAVLFMNTDGGVSGKDIFELDFVLIETA
ncbi:MAG: cytochrome o ubiquinol oxidase subunit 3, partial [Cellvibrionaceae bacterium]